MEGGGFSLKKDGDLFGGGGGSWYDGRKSMRLFSCRKGKFRFFLCRGMMVPLRAVFGVGGGCFFRTPFFDEWGGFGGLVVVKLALLRDRGEGSFSLLGIYFLFFRDGLKGGRRCGGLSLGFDGDGLEERGFLGGLLLRSSGEGGDLGGL